MGQASALEISAEGAARVAVETWKMRTEWSSHCGPKIFCQHGEFDDSCRTQKGERWGGAEGTNSMAAWPTFTDSGLFGTVLPCDFQLKLETPAQWI